jgi:hypothetical protein
MVDPSSLNVNMKNFAESKDSILGMLQRMPDAAIRRLRDKREKLIKYE